MNALNVFDALCVCLPGGPDACSNCNVVLFMCPVFDSCLWAAVLEVIFIVLLGVFFLVLGCAQGLPCCVATGGLVSEVDAALDLPDVSARHVVKHGGICPPSLL